MKMRLIRRFCAALSAFTGLSVAASAQLVENEELHAFGDEWEYLLYAPDNGGVFTPSDPSAADPDFYSTWHTGGAGYNGPPFQSGPAPLGYDVVTGLTLNTNIWGNRDGADAPPPDQRFTAYFRTTITPTEPTTDLRFSGILDDGCVIYVNGIEVIRSANMTADEDVWDLLTTATGSEVNPIELNVPDLSLPADTPAVIGISVHSATADSSDMGMDFRIVSLAPPTASPPPNDEFSAAEILSTDLPVTVAGRTHDGLAPFNLGATTQGGEPMHGGVANVGSIWYSYTPTADGTVAVSTAGSSFDTVLGVYIVNAQLELEEIASSTGDDRFYPGATLIIDVTGGTEYFIAIDGMDNGGAPELDDNYGTTSLTVRAAPASILTPISLLLPAGSDWHYLLAAQDVDATTTNQPIDPALFGPGDPDFHTTWHTAAAYDGPPFSGPAPALLGYGVIDADPVVTDIWGARDIDGDLATDDLLPPSGQRYAAYFRTTFTPTSPVAHLGFRGLIDDGAAVFINGVEVSKINFIGDTSDWQSFAVTAVDTELGPQEGVAADVNLPANVPVEIAVTLRNPNATSSDMGFDLEVYSIEEPVVDFGTPFIGNAPVKASFETAAVDATSGLGDGGSIDNLPWTATSGVVKDTSNVVVDPDLPPGDGNAIFVNNGRIDVVSGPVDLDGVDNATVIASVDVRTFEDSTGSDFEDVDFIEVYLEGSTDGFFYSRIASIMPRTVGIPTGGGGVDSLKPLELPDSAYTTFVSSAGVIPPSIRSVRIVVAALNNSDSERFLLDNLCLGTAVPAFEVDISHNAATGENTLTWNTDGVSVYELRYSRTDLVGYEVIAFGSDLGTATHTPPAGTTEGFYRVYRFDD